MFIILQGNSYRPLKIIFLALESQIYLYHDKMTYSCPQRTYANLTKGITMTTYSMIINTQDHPRGHIVSTHEIS